MSDDFLKWLENHNTEPDPHKVVGRMPYAHDADRQKPMPYRCARHGEYREVDEYPAVLASHHVTKEEAARAAGLVCFTITTENPVS